MKVLGGIFLGIICLVLLLGMTWLFQGNDFFLYKVFAPQYEQVRHDTFKESQAYNDGMKNEFESYYLEYSKATAEHKKAIASVVLRKCGSYDTDRLPSHLRSWIEELRREQTGRSY